MRINAVMVERAEKDVYYCEPLGIYRLRSMPGAYFDRDTAVIAHMVLSATSKNSSDSYVAWMHDTITREYRALKGA